MTPSAGSNIPNPVAGRRRPSDPRQHYLERTGRPAAGNRRPIAERHGRAASGRQCDQPVRAAIGRRGPRRLSAGGRRQRGRLRRFCPARLRLERRARAARRAGWQSEQRGRQRSRRQCADRFDQRRRLSPSAASRRRRFTLERPDQSGSYRTGSAVNITWTAGNVGDGRHDQPVLRPRHDLGQRQRNVDRDRRGGGGQRQPARTVGTRPAWRRAPTTSAGYLSSDGEPTSLAPHPVDHDLCRRRSADVRA